MFIGAGSTLAILCLGYAGVTIASGNFHAVTPNTVYRSAELSESGFRETINRHKIRSVLNLRGENLDKPWYQTEMAAMRATGAVHYDVAISSRRIPAPDKIERIVSILRDAPKPLLIHCHSGSDRSGLAAALYLYAIERRSPEEAARQLSLAYGHFPYFGSHSVAMDETFDAYVRAQPH